MRAAQITILHETPDVLIINKPTGLDSQNSRPDRPSVVGWLEKKCSFRGLVHRLDFGTSGIMILAKNEKAAKHVTDDLQKGAVTRTYRAIVMGRLEQADGSVTEPLDGQDAITHYKRLEVFANATDLEVTLETGRKHQIRKHMLWLNHPIIGDHLYRKKGSDLLFPRPALHSWKLHLWGSEYTAPLPSDLEGLIQRFRKSHTDFKA